MLKLGQHVVISSGMPAVRGGVKTHSRRVAAKRRTRTARSGGGCQSANIVKSIPSSAARSLAASYAAISRTVLRGICQYLRPSSPMWTPSPTAPGDCTGSAKALSSTIRRSETPSSAAWSGAARYCEKSRASLRRIGSTRWPSSSRVPSSSSLGGFGTGGGSLPANRQLLRDENLDQ